MERHAASHASLRHRPDAGGVQNGDSAKLEDVLVGEVWLASGQSNMLFRLNQTTTAKEDIAASGDDQLRLLNNIPQAHTNNAPYSGKDFDAVTTDNFYKGQWAASSPSTSGPMTAVGYYFGKKLREGLGIPVGIIHSSLGARKSQRGSPGRSLMQTTVSAPCAATTGWTPPLSPTG